VSGNGHRSGSEEMVKGIVASCGPSIPNLYPNPSLPPAPVLPPARNQHVSIDCPGICVKIRWWGRGI